jgi:hypothetical protein
MVVAALLAVALPLAASICIESLVAALFGFRRELTAVIWVNLVTNPVLTLVWLSLFWLGFGKTVDATGGAAGYVAPSTWMWFLLAGLEVVVVIVEWRLLLMALGRKAFGPRRLLTVSVVMNAVSATLGTLLLSRLSL